MHTQALCYQVQTPTCKNKLCEQGGLHSERRPGQAAGTGIVLADGVRLRMGLSRMAWGQVFTSERL